MEYYATNSIKTLICNYLLILKLLNPLNNLERTFSLNHLRTPLWGTNHKWIPINIRYLIVIWRLINSFMIWYMELENSIPNPIFGTKSYLNLELNCNSNLSILQFEFHIKSRKLEFQIIGKLDSFTIYPQHTFHTLQTLQRLHTFHTHYTHFTHCIHFTHFPHYPHFTHTNALRAFHTYHSLHTLTHFTHFTHDIIYNFFLYTWVFLK